MSETFTPKTLIAGDYPRISESVILAVGQSVLRGTVLGKLTHGAATSAPKAGGNTGAGTLTALTIGNDAKLGVYQVRAKAVSAVTGAITSAVKNGGNTGAGTVTVLSKGANAKVGVYTLRCTAAGVGVGTFEVVDPDGFRLASVVAAVSPGTAYAGPHINFTLMASGADFIVGDGFNITVAAGVAGATFSVVGPDGEDLIDAVASAAGAAYESDQVSFTLTSAGANFIVGDGFDITVAIGAGNYVKCVSTARNGSQHPVCVAAEDMNATSAARNISVYMTGEFVESSLIFGGADTIADHRDALRARSIYVRPIMSA